MSRACVHMCVRTRAHAHVSVQPAFICSSKMSLFLGGVSPHIMVCHNGENSQLPRWHTLITSLLIKMFPSRKCVPALHAKTQTEILENLGSSGNSSLMEKISIPEMVENII